VNPYAELTADGPLFLAQSAIAARLQLAFPAPRFNHEILPAAVTPAMWSELARRTPMIALGFVGIRPSAQSGRQMHGRADWRVVPVIRNAAGPRARLLGDRQGPGQLGVMQVAIAALQGMSIPGVGTAEVGDATNLYADGYADEHAALSGISVSVPFSLHVAASLDDLLTVGVTWAFGAEGTAASSTIQLQGAS